MNSNSNSNSNSSRSISSTLMLDPTTDIPAPARALRGRARRVAAAAAFLSCAAFALAGCTGAAGGASVEAPDAASAGESVTVSNAWVKAAENGMSAAFGELENTGTDEVTVVSVSSPASTALELHETVANETGEMAMREKDGGFTIEPGETLTLEPGGNHIMLMDLPSPVVAGDEVTFTLTFSDESTLEFTAPAKDYAGANENYEDDGEEMSMDMDHSGHGE